MELYCSLHLAEVLEVVILVAIQNFMQVLLVVLVVDQLVNMLVVKHCLMRMDKHKASEVETLPHLAGMVEAVAVLALQVVMQLPAQAFQILVLAVMDYHLTSLVRSASMPLVVVQDTQAQHRATIVQSLPVAQTELVDMENLSNLTTVD
jgi:hypothetical protein